MKRPNFQPIFEKNADFCERTSDQPVNTLIPGQAIDLATLIKRFESGQRLNVHENFKPMSNMSEGLYVEAFEDAPPDDIHDIVDVHAVMREHEQVKRDHKKRQAEKGKEATGKEAPAPNPPMPE